MTDRNLTFQMKSQDSEGNETNNPRVAGGTEIEVFVKNMKEIFQKSPQFQSIQRSPDDKNQGASTLVTDTLKAKHKFQITGFLYNGKDGHYSLDSSIRNSNDNGAPSKDTVTADEFVKNKSYTEWYVLGDTEIKWDSESVSTAGGTSLKRGFRKPIVAVDTTNEVFTVEGDETSQLSSGDPLIVEGSTGNDGSYSVSSASYDSTNDETDITVNEDITDSTADGFLIANDYEMDYAKGQIRYFDNGDITTSQETNEILPGITFTKTVIDNDFEVSYVFNGRPINIAKLFKRMGQLGGPVIMRKNKQSLSAESGEVGASYTFVPTKVQLVEQSNKPEQVKIEMEGRVASTKV